MPTIKYKEGGDYPELPVRTPLLVKVIESDYVTEPNPFYGKATGKKDKDGEDIVDTREERDVVKVVMEVVEGDYTGSRIWCNFTASINEKSKLLPFLQAVNDHELTREELKAFDTDDLVGMRVWVSGEYGPKDVEKKFLRPTGFMRVQAATTAKPARAARAAKPAPTAKPATSARDAALAALKAKQAAELAALEGDGEASTATADDDPDGFDPDETPF
jgi:hypothetical protein